MKSLPRVVYVKWEREGDEEYLLVSEKMDGIGSDGEKIGVYELKQVKIKRIRESLE